MPGAENVEDIIDAPVVAVNGSMILVDGALAGNTREIDASGRVSKIDALFTLLVDKRRLWERIAPGRRFPGVCVLEIDEAQSALVTKAAFHTAALAGYTNISFVVRRMT